MLKESVLLKIFCHIIYGFTVTFDQLNASLLNKHKIFTKKNQPIKPKSKERKKSILFPDNYDFLHISHKILNSANIWK